jgi:Chromo (CHRromatin Organisation MOdifier) domain
MSAQVAYFNIEKILNFRFSKGSPEYLIKWKDYGLAECTWEPLKHLLYSLDMVKIYHVENNIQFNFHEFLKSKTNQSQSPRLAPALEHSTLNKLPIPAKQVNNRKVHKPVKAKIPKKCRVTPRPSSKPKIIGLLYFHYKKA